MLTRLGRVVQAREEASRDLVSELGQLDERLEGLQQQWIELARRSRALIGSYPANGKPVEEFVPPEPDRGWLQGQENRLTQARLLLDTLDTGGSWLDSTFEPISALGRVHPLPVTVSGHFTKAQLQLRAAILDQKPAAITRAVSHLDKIVGRINKVRRSISKILGKTQVEQRVQAIRDGLITDDGSPHQLRAEIIQNAATRAGHESTDDLIDTHLMDWHVGLGSWDPVAMQSAGERLAELEKWVKIVQVGTEFLVRPIPSLSFMSEEFPLPSEQAERLSEFRRLLREALISMNVQESEELQTRLEHEFQEARFLLDAVTGRLKKLGVEFRLKSLLLPLGATPDDSEHVARFTFNPEHVKQALDALGEIPDRRVVHPHIAEWREKVSQWDDGDYDALLPELQALEQKRSNLIEKLGSAPLRETVDRVVVVEGRCRQVISDSKGKGTGYRRQYVESIEIRLKPILTSSVRSLLAARNAVAEWDVVSLERSLPRLQESWVQLNELTQGLWSQRRSAHAAVRALAKERDEKVEDLQKLKRYQGPEGLHFWGVLTGVAAVLVPGPIFIFVLNSQSVGRSLISIALEVSVGMFLLGGAIPWAWAAFIMVTKLDERIVEAQEAIVDLSDELSKKRDQYDVLNWMVEIISPDHLM